MEAQQWTINDMSLPARKVVTVWAGNAEVLVKQVEKGKAYAICQVPETAKVAQLIAAAPDLLEAVEMAQDYIQHIRPKVPTWYSETINAAIAKAKGA